MNIAEDFSFLNELRINNAELQSSLQNAYAYALNAETEYGVNPDQFISAVRKSCLNLASALCLALLPNEVPPAILQPYCSNNSVFFPVFGEETVHKIRYINTHATYTGELSKQEQVNLLRYLQLLSADTCRRLGQNVPESVLNAGITFHGIRPASPKEQTFTKTGFSEKTAADITRRFFREIEEVKIAEEKLRDSQDPALQEAIREINQKIDSILKDLEFVDQQTKQGNSLSRKSIEELNKKLNETRSSILNELHSYRTEHDHQSEQMLHEYENILSMLQQNSQSYDDLMAAVSDLQRMVNRMSETRQKEEANVSQHAMDVGEDIGQFVKDNHGNFEHLPSGAAAFIKKLVKTGAECVNLGKQYAKEAAESAKQAYNEAKEEMKHRSEKEEAPTPRKKPSFRQETSSSGYFRPEEEPVSLFGREPKPSFQLPSFRLLPESVTKYLTSKASETLQKRLGLLTGILLITWLTILIIFSGHDTVSMPLFITKFLSLVWYAISFIIGLLAAVTLVFTLIRILCGVWIRYRAGKLLKPYLKQILRQAIIAVILYMLGTYVHKQFFAIIHDGIGWKQILTLKDPAEIHRIFSWIIEIWRWS